MKMSLLSVGLKKYTFTNVEKLLRLSLRESCISFLFVILSYFFDEIPVIQVNKKAWTIPILKTNADDATLSLNVLGGHFQHIRA